MRLFILLLCLSLFACSKRIFIEKNEDNFSEAVIVEKKVLHVTYRNLKDQSDNAGIQINKDNCDTIRINGYEIASKKPYRQKYFWYLISESGENETEFSKTEIALLNRTMHILDSLNWCQKGKNFLNWKMIDAKNYRE